MSDKGFDRRTFVKGCVGVATAGALGGSLLGQFRPVSDVPVEIASITYPGIKVLKGSPAPYGLPLIPLHLNSAGEFVGAPDVEPQQLYWYKYCAHERAPGTRLDATDDNKLYYNITADKIAKGFDPWYREFLDQPVTPDQFPDDEPAPSFQEFPGVGASFRWRSEGVGNEDLITGIIVRSSKEILFERVPAGRQEQILNDWIVEDPNDPDYTFVAFCSFCTHFCCVPGFHESPLAKQSGYGDTVFCTCHLSRYDPWTITNYDRNIFLYPEFEAGGEAGGSEGGAASGGGGH